MKFSIKFYFILFLSRKNIFFKILKSRWEFNEPTQSDILVYDALPSISKDLQEILRSNTYQFFYTRGEVLNIPILFKTLITTGINKFRFNYKKKIIRSIDPKFVITQSDQDFNLYSLKKKYGGNFQVIVIQKSVDLGPNFKEFVEKKKIHRNSIDYYFACGDATSKKLQRYLSGTKFFNSGCFRNNAYPGQKHTDKKKVLFLSAWKPKFIFPEYEKEVLKLLEDYCKMRKLKLVISTRFSETKYISEINKSLNYNNHKFELRKNENSVYKSICSYDLIVFCIQSIGYEALSRGKKVLCFPFAAKKYNQLDVIATNFMGKDNKRAEGKFWANKFLKKKIFKKIDFVLNLNNIKWLKLLKKEFNNYVIYDKDNKLLIKKLKKIGIPLKSYLK